MNQYNFFHFVMFQSNDRFIFFNFKSSLFLANEFFKINNHIVLFHNKVVSLDSNFN